MRKHLISIKKHIIALLLISIISSNVLEVMASPLADKGKDGTTNQTSDNKASNDNTGIVSADEVIKINDIDDFNEFIDNCKLDSYSVGKTFILTRDLDIDIKNYKGVPYFNGTFKGDGHTIKVKNPDYVGSDYGFFRYVGKLGIVENLHVEADVEATGSATNIGGICGVNYGTVSSCSYTGSIKGDKKVGGIVGFNKNDAIITSCSQNAIVLGTDYTGGICGFNAGIISDSENNGDINISELDSSVDIGDSVDVGAFNITKSMMNRNDMGGIAGGSSGIITACFNDGTIGYNHSGYNVGGICGRQSGEVIGCSNEGDVYGRKDVGGIVGQAEPYIESEYLNDKLSNTKDEINRLSDSITGINSAINSATSDSSKYLNKLVDSYGKDLDSIKSTVDEISKSVSDNSPEAKAYIVSINKAIKNIEALSEEEKKLAKSVPTKEEIEDIEKLQKKYDIKDLGDIKNIKNISAEDYKKLKDAKDSIESVSANKSTSDELQKNLKSLYDNMDKLQSTYSVSANSAADAAQKFANNIKDNGNYDNLQNLVNSVDSGTGKILASINEASGQLNHMSDMLSEDIESITGNKDLIYDISSLDTISANGVISRCVNKGSVEGDINIGGIAGTMNIEYEADPELDIDLTEKLNIRLRTSVNDIIIYCENDGTITSKRNCVGGISGSQEFGLIYSCECYGNISTEAGDYTGGVVGQSKGSVWLCYSLSRLTGKAYVGGITGYGVNITECISLSDLEADGEYLGCIAGFVTEDGTVKDNYFINDNYEGIDGISYQGRAERSTYDEIISMEGKPEIFDYVKVTFTADDELITESSIPYGSSLISEDYPKLEDKPGYYVRWEEPENEIIKSNTTINAKYIPWNQSLASSILNDDGGAMFLVSGEFYEESALNMKEISGPEALEKGEKLKYAYSWSLTNVDGLNLNGLTGHFYVGDKAKDAEIYILKDDKWSKVDSVVDGSYITCTIPYGASFAVVTVDKDYTYYYIAGIVLLLIIILIISTIKRRKLKKLLKESEEEIRKRDMMARVNEN